MGIPGRLLVSVVGMYKQAADDNTKRFYNLASFLGINLKSPEKAKEMSKESSELTASEMELEASAKASVLSKVKEWFTDLLGDYLPEGYFKEENRKKYPQRDKMYADLYKIMFYGMKDSLEREFYDLANKQGYQLNHRDLESLYEPYTIDGEVLKMLASYKKDPKPIKSAIHKTLLKKDGFLSKAKDGGLETVPGLNRPGLLWFSPIVTPELYARYEELIKNNPEKYKNKTPEDLDPKVVKDKADPNIIEILSSAGKFDIDILDVNASSAKGLSVTKYRFRIPLLDKHDLYKGLTFDRKFPPGKHHLRQDKLYDVVVKETGKKGLMLVVKVLDEVESEENLSRVYQHGFIDYATFKVFTNMLVNDYVREITKRKDLNELIADMGGEVKLRVKSERGRSDDEDLAEEEAKLEKGKKKKDDGGQKTDRREEKTIGQVDSLGDLSSYGESSYKKEDAGSKGLSDPEKIRKYKQDTEQVLKDKQDEVVSVWGPYVSEYLFSLTPEEGRAMAEAIVKKSTFKKLNDIIFKIVSGDNIQYNLGALLVSKEVVRKALMIIFSESTAWGISGWKVLLEDYIKNDIMNDFPEIEQAVRALIYRESLEGSGGENGKKLSAVEIKEAMENAFNSGIPYKKYTASDINKYLSQVLTPVFFSNYTDKFLNPKIKESILSLRDHPAFKRFFERLKVWDDVLVKKWLWTKLDNVLAGDAPPPIKVPKDLKATMVTDISTDVRDKDNLEKLEKQLDAVEEKLKAENKNPEEDKTWSDLQVRLKNIKNKAIKTDRIVVTDDSGELTGSGEKFLDKLIKHFIDDRIKQITVKNASYSGIVKLAYNLFFKNNI